MSVLEVARAHARDRVALAERIRREFALAWTAVDPARISESWAARIATLLSLLTGAQRLAADSADRYLSDVLDEQGLDPVADGSIGASALAGIASDGRPLASLLAQPGITAKVALAQGATIDRAMAAGGALAELIGHTQVADAGRVADQVALTARPRATGYVRMIVGKTCSRCLLLAGRWYAYNTGFRRHPRCDCVHIPGREDSVGDLRTDPAAAFRAMGRAEQDQVFGKAGAEAIRSGADISSVVNARRGMATVGETRTRTNADGLVVNESIRRQTTIRVAGRDLFTTTEAATRQRRRLMPEQIFRSARDRDDAVRLLRLHGYIY